MSRAQLIILILILLGIFSILSILFFSVNPKNSQKNTLAQKTAYYEFDGSRVGKGFIYEADQSFFLTANIDKIYQTKSTVEADIDTLVKSKPTKLKVEIFDKSQYPYFFISSIADRSKPLNTSNEKVLEDSDSILRQAKAIEGKLLILVFNTKRFPCNTALLTFLKNGGSFNCRPHASQISIYNE